MVSYRRQIGIRFLIMLMFFGGGGLLECVASDDTNFVAKLLATNRPWLNPTVVEGTYNLNRRVDGYADEVLGAYSFSDQDTRWYGNPHRVGSILWTPLHRMAAKNVNYSWKVTGNTVWNLQKLMVLDVTFETNISVASGFGGQGDTSFSYGKWIITQVRMLIDTNSFVPVVIGEASDGSTNSVSNIYFEFDPLFFNVEEGRAPRSLDCYISNSIFEHEEFRVIKGAWMFKRGDAWNGASSKTFVGHIQTFEMIDVDVSAALKMNLQRTGDGASVLLPSSETVDLSVQTATNLNGPWEVIPKSALESGNKLNIKANGDQRFYRFAQ